MMNYFPLPSPDSFYEQVWEIARQIPMGRVATYGQIAQLLAPPKGINVEAYQVFGSRWVGNGMAACPDDVPWQRVINSQGKISKRPGAEKQRLLLEREGLVFVKDKIDLKAYQWRGPNEADIPRQHRLF